MSRLLYSGFRWLHHDIGSGYDHVVAAPEDYVNGNTLWGGTSRAGTFRRRVNFVLVDLVTLLRSPRYDAVLLFYPEQTSFVSSPLLRLAGKRVIQVLHLGDDFWCESPAARLRWLRRWNLRFANRVIVLSDAQRSRLEQQYHGRIATIPHGAWPQTGPAASGPPGSSVAVIGHNYRDYEGLRRIIETFAKELPAIRFDLVGMDYGRLGAARSLPTVVCHPRLSKEAYDRLIRTSLFVLLPLLEATANNALLDALTSGVPVIATRRPGILGYVPDDRYVFESADELCAVTRRRLAATDEERRAERDALIAFAEQHFAWPRVRQAVRDFCLADEATLSAGDGRMRG